MVALGAELTVYHIENGARKFIDVAMRLADALGVSLRQLRPYLRSWYNGARDMMEDAGLDVSDMDSPDQVRDALVDIDALPETPASERYPMAQTQPIVHPPWRTIAAEILKAKDPERWRDLRKTRELEAYLDERDEAARGSYEHLYRQILERNPAARETWAMSAAEEMVVKYVLDPTT